MVAPSPCKARRGSVESIAGLPVWEDLPSELLGMVLKQMDADTSSAVAMTGACGRWRGALMLETEALRSLSISVNLRTPVKAHGRLIPAHLLRIIDCPALPLLLTRSAVANNLSANVACAALLDAQRKPGAALRYWKRAAKLGHAAAQVRMGVSHYKGCHDVPRDVEEAQVWLLRGAKQLLGSCGEAPCGELASAGLLLGYILLDGESSMRQDLQEAVRWFKVSAKHGSKEAEKILGSLYNTGQYG